MTEFLAEIAGRMAAAQRSLEQARADGDDYLISVRLGEIESLQRLRDDHGGQEIIELEPTSAAALVLDQPAGLATS